MELLHNTALILTCYKSQRAQNKICFHQEKEMILQQLPQPWLGSIVQNWRMNHCQKEWQQPGADWLYFSARAQFDQTGP